MDETSYGDVALWAPLMQWPTSLFFAHVEGKLFEDEVVEGSFALGYRQMLESGWNLGIWSGLDLRHTEDSNTFWQLSGGLEALSPNWDVRVNAYLPLSDPQSSPSIAEVMLSGDNIFMIGGEEVPLYGVDGEVGFRLFGHASDGLPAGGTSCGSLAAASGSTTRTRWKRSPVPRRESNGGWRTSSNRCRARA